MGRPDFISLEYILKGHISRSHAGTELSNYIGNHPKAKPKQTNWSSLNREVSGHQSPTKKEVYRLGENTCKPHIWNNAQKQKHEKQNQNAQIPKYEMGKLRWMDIFLKWTYKWPACVWKWNLTSLTIMEMSFKPPCSKHLTFIGQLLRKHREILSVG